MNTRIIQLRKNLHLNQEEFGKRIGMSGAAISRYELGQRSIPDSIVFLICKEFNVREEWLREGEGEPFEELSFEDELQDLMTDALKEEPGFKQRLLAVLLRMPQDSWDLLEEKVVELYEATKKAPPNGDA